MKWCTVCLMPETRPRITFSAKGVCNACQWAQEKKTVVDWKAREKELKQYCRMYRSKTGNFDVIAPVSGGKDSSYVAYKLKHDLQMHPLTVSIVPPLTFPLGDDNLNNFISHGYDCIKIYPNPDITRKIARIGFVKFGDPLMGWITNVQAAIFRIAVNFRIPFIMFGEEGETEYGGLSKLKNRPFYSLRESIEIYVSNNNPKQYLKNFSRKELYWWMYPTAAEFTKNKLAIAHWSYFENWDPYEHYLVAKKQFNMKEKQEASVGTYTNFAQTDTCLFDLHCYLMYLKFGFGRCSADASIDIRRGALGRDQAVEMVRRFDNTYPDPYIPTYLEYFRMTKKEFDRVLDRHVNKKLFTKRKGRWMPMFIVT